MKQDPDLLLFSYRAALSLARERLYRSAVKHFLAPLRYWHSPEFSAALGAIDGEGAAPLRILDIASPKLLSLYLSLRRGHTVHATDLIDREIFDRYAPSHDALSGRMGREGGEYVVSYRDARNLEYDGESFDVVYSLEVLGHIPDDGDSRAMQEIRRVLRPGGLAVVAVPFRNRRGEVFVDHDVFERKYRGEPVFYVRQYDDESLDERLITPSGMVLEKKVLFRERIPFDSWWGSIPGVLKIPFHWIEPWVARLNIREEDTFPRQEVSSSLAMGALVVLRKDGGPLQAPSRRLDTLHPVQ